MGERIQALAHVLTGKDSVEEYTLEELQQLAQQYPYFAPAQFLLLQKLQPEGSAEYKEQKQKAILYYHDPLQFEAFISPTKFYVDDSAFEEGEVFTSASTKPSHDTLPPVRDKLANDDQSFAVEDAPKKHNAVILPAKETSSSLTHPATLDKQEIETRELDEVNASFENEEHEAETASIPERAEQQDEPLSVEEKKMEEDTNLTKSSLVVKEETGQDSNEKQHLATAFENTPLETLNRNEKIGSEAVSHTKESVPLFEPYHAVDYFASQGIKVSTGEMPTDKLGKQLRSFTEWLKIMKRLPATQMAKAPESTAEKTVENMATHSVAESEVVTETMAEVWAKQGAREKAVETYNKLSLLNPSKRAYFAAKIENLKQS